MRPDGASCPLQVPASLIENIRKKIDAVIPPWGSSRNPVDIVGDADFNRFRNVLNHVLSHPNVGTVISMCTPSGTLDYDKLAKVSILFGFSRYFLNSHFEILVIKN